MKAMVMREPGGPLRLEDVPLPRIGATEALVRVRATGVGLTVVIMTAVPGRVTAFPRIPGHEIAGEVVEIGGEVTNVRRGDRVTCHFYLTCGACAYCRSGRQTLCAAFGGYVGMASDGGYAEYAAIPARNLIPIPAGVCDLDAAVAADAIATPLHACREEARVGPGDHVLIVGVVDGRQGDVTRAVLRATDGRGVDAAIDTVASTETLEASVASLGRSPRSARHSTSFARAASARS